MHLFTISARSKMISVLLGAAFAAMTAHSAGVYAQVAQEPLFLGGKATPNMIYNMDESWSMAWRYMPDELRVQGGTIYGNPWATGTGDSGDGNGERWAIAFHPDDVSTSTSDSRNDLATFVARANANNIATDLLSARLRSYAFNTIYYNPEVRYEPWYKADGTKYPDAAPAAALLHPLMPNGAKIDLQGEHTFNRSIRWCGSLEHAGANNLTASSSTTRACRNLTGETLAPAVWYEYLGNRDEKGAPTSKAELENLTNFMRVRIMDHSSFERQPSRTDCAAIATGLGNICTQAEEYQNFANWFTYSRTRMFTAIAATTKAFAGFDGGLRLGYGRMHYNGIIERGVRELNPTSKQEFFEWLYKMAGATTTAGLYGSASSTSGHFFAGGTYLRRSTEEAGRYYRTDEPYRLDPTQSNSTLLGCRKNYHLLMSDGIESDRGWNSYSKRDSSRDTLELIAKHYYNTDLMSKLPNNVPPDPENNNTQQHMVNFMVGLGVDIPDMVAAAEGSKGNYFSASNVQEFAKSLTDTLVAVIVREGSSAASIATNSTKLDSGTLVYQASFDSKDWSGRLRAYRPNAQTGQIIEGQPIWDTNNSVTRTRFAAHKIFTPSGQTGTGATLTQEVNFNWNALGAAQKTLLKAGDSDAKGEQRLNWLRGSATNEGTTSGALRQRTRLLGDIVNSDPVFVGAQDFGYAQFGSKLTADEKRLYESFLATKKTRPEMLYVGANGGMLHGFNANNGAIISSYVPAAVFPKLHELTQQNYTHKYFVDGSPRVVDAFIDNAWRTVLVGATAGGGNAVFALDITNPDTPSLLWEYSGTSSETMGLSMSAPSIVRLADGNWYAVFGNGYDRAGGNIKLIVLDLATGAFVKAIDTGVSSTNSGLATVAPVDVDSDRITDYIYAGDLTGNLWRFTLTSNNPNQWGARKLFSASSNNTAQPITMRPEIGRHPDGGVLIYFGTGRYFAESDKTITNSPQIQTFYGIRDTFSTSGNSQTALVSRNSLERQEIIYEGTPQGSSIPYRVTSNNSSTTVPASGWYINLVAPGASGDGERAVAMPILRFGRIIFTTIIPDSDQCGQGGRSWLMELNALNGGRLDYSVFDINNDMLIDEGDFITITIDGEQVRVPVSGQAFDEMIKTPGIISAGDLEYKYTSGSSGSIGVIREQGAGDILGRQSWRQLQ